MNILKYFQERELQADAVKEELSSSLRNGKKTGFIVRIETPKSKSKSPMKEGTRSPRKEVTPSPRPVGKIIRHSPSSKKDNHFSYLPSSVC
jgi:hypothetical protein